MVWAPKRKSYRSGSVILSQGPGSSVITTHTYLLVYLGPIFYFSYYHSYNGTSVGCSKGKKLLVGGDVTIPWVWVPEENKLRWNCQKPNPDSGHTGDSRHLCPLLFPPLSLHQSVSLSVNHHLKAAIYPDKMGNFWWKNDFTRYRDKRGETSHDIVSMRAVPGGAAGRVQTQDPKGAEKENVSCKALWHSDERQMTQPQ